MGRRLHLWPVTQVLHAGALAAPLPTGETRTDHGLEIDAIVRGLGWYRSGQAWGPMRGARPRYADDVAWVGLALAALANQRDAPLPLEVGEALAFAMACEHADGGVRWHEDAETRHTCATAPAAHLALVVHRSTGDQEAIAFARRSMSWLDTSLRREDDLYGDHRNGDPDLTAWAYNQGEAAAAWSLLAATGDAAAGVVARRTSAAAVAWLADAEVLWRQPQVFVGIGVRCLLPLDPTGRLLGAVEAHLDRIVREGLDDDGFPADGAAGRYGDDAAIDLAGLVQIAAAASVAGGG
jgi:hypothetical protein